MADISSLVGGQSGNTGGAGMRYSAGNVQLRNPVSDAQLSDAQSQEQQALNQQQQLVTALMGQNGIQNQSNVYNQYAQLAQGQGPNPAQNMLNQATSANVANQAALMASQRGANQNVGLIARQAGMQGANAQQNAAAQGATMEAQQQLGALGQMGGLSTQQVAQQQNATAQDLAAQQQRASNYLNAISNYNSANVGMQGNINSANAGVAGKVAEQQGNMIGNIFGGAAKAAAMADGGEVSQPPVTQNQKQPTSFFGKFMAGMNDNAQQQNQLSKGSYQVGEAFGKGLGSIINSLGSSKQDPNAMAGGPMDNMGSAAADMPIMAAAKGGKVPAILSPGEAYIKPDKVKDVAQGKADVRKVGAIVPGRAKYKGDNLKNDTVPTKLDEGGFVIPRTVMNSNDPAKNAAKFVAAYLAKNKKSL